MNYPMIKPICEFLGNLRNRNPIEHPGLLLDRYAAYAKPNFDKDSFNQESGQKPHIKRVIETAPPAQVRQTILNEWDALITGLPQRAELKVAWKQNTLWRLALHLSRASTLENGSLSLHPLYGFAYLPGSGIKGLARACAELNAVDQADVCRIFGNTDSAGNVVFLEAWPERWPALQCDIVNNHHKDYYANRGATPPGDWESPNPTYFLAVAPGTTFRFAVVARDHATPASDLRHAASWLQEALSNLGAGAKTAAGYGYFGKVKPL
jgi:CRISPR-associated protein Cmr6